MNPETLNSAVGSMLAEQHSVYGHSGQDVSSPHLRDFRALTDGSNQPLNDITVRVQHEGPDVVSVYVMRASEGDTGLLRSARFTQMSPDTIARVIAAEMVGDDDGPITD